MTEFSTKVLDPNTNISSSQVILGLLDELSSVDFEMWPPIFVIWRGGVTSGFDELLLSLHSLAVEMNGAAAALVPGGLAYLPIIPSAVFAGNGVLAVRDGGIVHSAGFAVLVGLAGAEVCAV